MISESQYSLFVEHHHTSIICLTRRSIKLVFKLSFQFCIIVTDTCINIEGSVESFELTPRTGQRLCAAAAAASPPATDCLSNLPAPDTAQ